MVTPDGRRQGPGLRPRQADAGRRRRAARTPRRWTPRRGSSRPGTVAGTPAYMSPEQAAGGAVDARSDIFSFGAVLYEMVTGRRPFAGGSSAEMLAALLKEQPKPPSELVPDVPKELERIILRCLRKEPGRRFQHMADVKVELQELKEESDSQAAAPAGAAAREAPIAASLDGVGGGRPPGPGRRRGRGAVAPAAARASPADRRPAHVGPVGRRRQLLARRHADRVRSAGDDGDNWDIWLKIVGEAEARRLTTDPAAERDPAWSPDGTQIAFVRCPGPRISVGPAAGPSTSCRRWAARRAGCPTSPRGPGSPGPPTGAGWPRRRPAAGERPAGRHPPDLRRGGEPRAVTFPKAPGLRRLPGLLAGRPCARLRFLRGRGGVPGLRRVRPAARLRAPAPGSGSTPDPAAVVEPGRGLDA